MPLFCFCFFPFNNCRLFCNPRTCWNGRVQYFKPPQYPHGWGDAFAGHDLSIGHNFRRGMHRPYGTDRSDLKPHIFEPIDSGRGPGFAGAGTRRGNHKGRPCGTLGYLSSIPISMDHGCYIPGCGSIVLRGYLNRFNGINGLGRCIRRQ